MKSSWKDMNKTEKGLFIAYCILCVVGVIAVATDISGKWKHADIVWMITIGAVLVVECVQNWNKNRKLAILEVICGVIMLACSIGDMLL